MNKFFRIILIAFLISAFLGGCGKKAEKIEITGWQKYRDPYVDLSFTYPQSWHVVAEGSRISVYSSPDVASRFDFYTAEGRDGIKLLVATKKMESPKTLGEQVDEIKRDLVESGFDLKPVSSSAIDGIPATLIQYEGILDKKNRIGAYQADAVRDSLVYTIKYEAFNELYSTYKFVFDSLLASIKLPKPAQKAQQTQEPVMPSTSLLTFENTSIKVSYPDNFNANLQKPKSPAIFSLEIKGYRQDCTIYLAIIPAKNTTLEKVVEQNSKFYKSTSQGTSVVDGINSIYLNYSPMKEIESRVYFVLKNDKLFRVIFNYYAPMKEVYLPVFEKVVNSLKLK